MLFNHSFVIFPKLFQYKETTDLMMHYHHHRGSPLTGREEAIRVMGWLS